jgi:hypothetical protein
MTGAAPISPEEYASLPKLGTFRAWLPSKVDLTESFPKPGYQGQQPDCVAWATTYAGHSFLHGRTIGHRPSGPDEEMSPAYVYNRLRPAGSPCNRPVRIVDALNLLVKEGTVSLADFPDNLSTCNVPAAAELKTKAADLRLGSWRAIKRENQGMFHSRVNIDDIKGALSRSEPVVFAMPIAADWFALKGDTTYTHLTPESSHYHAMALVGYDEGRQAFRVINSWGTFWGDGGYAWIGYDTFTLLVDEAYALQPVALATSAPGSVLTPQQNFDDLLSKLPCGTAAATRSEGHLRVTGFGGSLDTLDTLHQAAIAVDPATVWNMAYHPWPQCEAEMTLAKPLEASRVTLMAQTEDGHPRGGDPVQMNAGEKFGITAETTPAKPYLSIVYIQADGSAVELYNGIPAADAAQHRRITIGTSGPKEVRFQVGPPYGNEMVIAIASAQAFWGPVIHTYATERQFLTGLRTRLTVVSPETVSAAVLRIQTKG